MFSVFLKTFSPLCASDGSSSLRKSSSVSCSKESQSALLSFTKVRLDAPFSVQVQCSWESDLSPG